MDAFETLQIPAAVNPVISRLKYARMKATLNPQMRLVLTKKKWENKWKNLNCNNNLKFPLSPFPILPTRILFLSFSSSSHSQCSLLLQQSTEKCIYLHSSDYLPWFFVVVSLHRYFLPAPTECIEKWIICNFVFSQSQNREKEKGYLCFSRLLCIHVLFSLAAFAGRKWTNTLLPSHPHLHCANTWPCRVCFHSLGVCVCASLCRAIIQGKKNEERYNFFRFVNYNENDSKIFLCSRFVLFFSTFSFVCEVRTKGTKISQSFQLQNA